MNKNAIISIHVDKTLKQSADKFFNQLGFSTERVLTAILEQTLKKKKLPVKIEKTPEEIEKEWENKPHIPNKETMRVFKEIDDYFDGKPIKTVHPFTSIDDLLASPAFDVAKIAFPPPASSTTPHNC
jgi:addiction module RelB/DinJ family antitoxin